MKKRKKSEIALMKKRLKESPAYRLAYKDHDFIDKDSLRPTRLQLELRKPEIIFHHHRIKSTIVVFGGTRIKEPGEAAAAVKKIETKLKKKPDSRELKRELAIAKSVQKKARYYHECHEFGRLVSSECQRDKDYEFVIVTGGGPGIMEAANRGAYDAGCRSVGLNIRLPMEQEPNPYITPELCMQFHYFAIRKMHFMLRAKALVAFPGGYGTLDELFEALTLSQTKVLAPMPIILFGEKYWKNIIDFNYLVNEGLIAPEDRELYVYVDKAIDAWNYIKYYYQSRGNNV